MSPTQPTSSPGGQRNNSRVAAYCIAVLVLMTAAGFAAVPLYRLFCQQTGFGGTVSRSTTGPTGVALARVEGAFAQTARGVPSKPLVYRPPARPHARSLPPAPPPAPTPAPPRPLPPARSLASPALRLAAPGVGPAGLSLNKPPRDALPGRPRRDSVGRVVSLNPTGGPGPGAGGRGSCRQRPPHTTAPGR